MDKSLLRETQNHLQTINIRINARSVSHTFIHVRAALALVLGPAICLGLAACSQHMNISQLLGTWVGEPTQTEWGGPYVFEFTFEPGGRLIVTARSAGVERSINREEKYTYKDGEVFAKSLNEGRGVHVSLEGETLVMSTSNPGDKSTRLKKK